MSSPVESSAKTSTPQKECKTSTWSTFLRRLAFWKAAKQQNLDKMFVEAVNELHPEWERQRLKEEVAARH